MGLGLGRAAPPPRVPRLKSGPSPGHHWQGLRSPNTAPSAPRCLDSGRAGQVNESSGPNLSPGTGDLGEIKILERVEVGKEPKLPARGNLGQDWGWGLSGLQAAGIRARVGSCDLVPPSFPLTFLPVLPFLHLLGIY